MCKKMSSDSCGSSSVSVSSSSNSHNTAHVEVAMDDHLFRLQEKLHRTTKILQEIQKLTPVCEEARPEDVKEKQVSNPCLVRTLGHGALGVPNDLIEQRDFSWETEGEPKT